MIIDKRCKELFGFLVRTFVQTICLWMVGSRRAPRIPRSLYKSSMNLETNWPPLSLITFFGSPNFLKTSRQKITATPELVILVVQGTRIFILVRYLVITKIALYPLDSGRGPTISTEIVSHGSVAMSVG